MVNQKNWFYKVSFILALIFGILLMTYSFLFLTHYLYRIYQVNRRSEWGVRFTQNDDKTLLITNVLADTWEKNEGLQKDDVILEINGKVPNDTFLSQKYWGMVNENLTLKYKHQQEIREINIKLSSNNLNLTLTNSFYGIVSILLIYAYVIVGLIGLYKQPYAKETLLISFFCMFFGVIVNAAVTLNYIETPISKIFYLDYIQGILVYFVLIGAAFWVWLFHIFPTKSDLYQKSKFKAIVSSFIVPIVMIIFLYISPRLFQSRALYNIVAPLIYFAAIAFNMSLGANLFKKGYYKIDNIIKKRQFSLLSLGLRYGGASVTAGWGLLITSLVIFHEIVAKFQLNVFIIIIFLILQIGGLLIPFGFLNAFFEYKLIETKGLLKRKLRYLVVTMIIFIIYFILVFSILKWWIFIFNMFDQKFIVLFTLIASLGFAPLNKYLVKLVENKLYPERNRYQTLLQNFIYEITRSFEINELSNHLSVILKSSMYVTPVVITAINNEMDCLEFTDNEQLKLEDSDKKIFLERTLKNGIFFWDEAIYYFHEEMNGDLLNWIKRKNIALSVPLIFQKNLIGLLHIGKKINNDDFTNFDLETIKKIADQTAIAIQNIKLQSEFLIKKRMEKELEMAKSIQKRLMPEIIPEIEGLDIHGESLSCYEVAGDYFDIMKLNDEKTLIVVADVSGKGAGAALLMSNLQASLRTSLSLDLDLKKAIEITNKLIFNNTLPSQFITLFAAIWNKTDNSLEYINAGHNPPILLQKKECTITSLDATGLVIGFLEQAEYELRKIYLSKEDIFFLYTDGLEEAMDHNDEEFGLERINEILMKNCHLTSENIYNIVIEELNKFIGKTLMKDDLTVITAKVK